MLNRFSQIMSSQGRIVFVLSIILLIVFSLTLDGFASIGNILSLIQSVSVLGILGLGMGVAVLSRGIDLAMVVSMVMSSALAFQLANNGTPLAIAMLAGVGFTVAVGLTIGVLVAYVEIPALFATLAMAGVVYGIGRMFLINGDNVILTGATEPLRQLGNGSVLGVPIAVIWFFLACAVIAFMLKYSKTGWFLRGMGDNPVKARNSGIPVRPLIVKQYVLVALITFVAGFVMSTLIGTMNTRLANSTMIYDVILVVVLGGIGLNGGKGSVFNIVVGTLLIGILLNGMTIMNVSYIMQNFLKGILLLIAIIADAMLNPRDEQTSQQGDI